MVLPRAPGGVGGAGGGPPPGAGAGLEYLPPAFLPREAELARLADEVALLHARVAAHNEGLEARMAAAAAGGGGGGGGGGETAGETAGEDAAHV